MVIFDIYKNEIAYYLNRKCASRTILGWAAILKYPNILQENSSWFENSRQYIGYHEITNLVPKISPPYLHDQKIRFCIIRDPIDRFISAYTNRLLFHKKPDISNMNIDYFIDNMNTIFEQVEYNDAKLHFQPQAHELGTDTSIYTHIFSFKEIHLIKQLLEKHANIKLPDIHLQQSKDTKKPILTNYQIYKLKKIYQIDYEIYHRYI